jgi:hypothetical protein
MRDPPATIRNLAALSGRCVGVSSRDPYPNRNKAAGPRSGESCLGIDYAANSTVVAAINS